MARHARYDRTTALEKAIGLFWAKGYHGSSMKQIEQALDMRPGSIYATFGSKDGLFSEALAAYAEQSGRELAKHIDGFDSIVEGLQNYLRGIARGCGNVDTAPSRACLVVKTLLESSNTHPALAAQANSILAAIEQTIAELLERAKANGELVQSVDSSRLARLLQAQIMGLRSMGERQLGSEAIAELGNDMAAILDGYRTQH
ncbi:TetR/AcrR family transcriptional regulator [Marinobacter sp. F3R08]|uniref:TetR/AcrR family transcriptional regulator n=1 Tax=Marinobacter sp. F3R08 TaxID=2841559 RepID=UPI001C09EB0D|nr:TetR/AcrR family transcriptional regulator [Marinobacter sp. F3R08]MBU2952813.1 TetR/AcrR family transcriptional regulator [Marinobacter sp. F3R08]